MPFKVSVSGEIVLRAPRGGVEVEYFEEEFVVGDDFNTPEKARVLIRRALAPELFRKRDNFKRLRTLEIDKFENTEEKSTDPEMEELLAQAIELNCLPENISNYKRPDHKRKALQKAIDVALEREKRLKEKNNNVEDQGYVD